MAPSMAPSIQSSTHHTLNGSSTLFLGHAARESRPRRSPSQWNKTYWEGKHLLINLLDIEVPMIRAINGPALRHPELPLLCDIVLASEDASFQDSAHFINGLIPGDGVPVVFPMLLGLNRGQYLFIFDWADYRCPKGLGTWLGQRSSTQGQAIAARLGFGGTAMPTIALGVAVQPGPIDPIRQTDGARTFGLRSGP